MLKSEKHSGATKWSNVKNVFSNHILDKVKKEQKEKITEEEKRARAEKERAERRKLLAAVMREWSKPKPDETLDDFNSFLLPSPDTVKTKIPSNLLGDVFQLIEFQKNFSNAFGDMQVRYFHFLLARRNNVLFSTAPNCQN